MKTKQILLNVCAILAIGTGATMLYTACGDDKPNVPTPPADTSDYWESGYQQRQLYGKVKTVKQWEDDPTDYDWLEYDSKGNLIQDRFYRPNGTFSGNTLYYDSQNRLIKILYGGDLSNPSETAEFGYDGRHTNYIPTNVYSMADLRLNPGVTSVKYTIRGDEPMTANLTSVSGSTLTFVGQLGGSSLFGSFENNELTIKAKCNGSYPTEIEFINGGEVFCKANVTFDGNGLPIEVSASLNGGSKQITRFTTIAGFLLMTEEFNEGDEEDGKYNTYNEKGLAITTKSRSYQYRYSYEYDAQGNWTKRISEYLRSDNVWEADDTLTREITYW